MTDQRAARVPRDLSIHEASAAIAAGQLTSRELMQSCLEQIEALNGATRAVIHLRPVEDLLADADRSDARHRSGRALGPLDGIPVGLKANFADVNAVTSAGSAVLADWVPDADAEAVSALKAAGAIVVGMLNMHEFANGPTGVNQTFGTPVNPVDPTRLAGGSSGGSALAVALRMVLGATGSDTGGSIRTPAAFCGVVGLKPTRGLVSTAGVVPFSASLDHAGPMAATIDDVGLLLRGMLSAAAADRLDSYPADQPLESLRLGVERAYFTSMLEEPVRAGYQRLVAALEDAGRSVTEVTWPSVHLASDAALTILLPEAATVHHGLLETRLEDYGSDVRASLLSGRLYRAVDYLNAKEVQRRLSRELEAIFEDVDVLLTPTVGIVAPTAEQETVTLADGAVVDMLPAITRLTVPFNLTGHPAMSIPLGTTDEGLHFGLQLVGRHDADELLIKVAAQIHTTFVPGGSSA